MQKKQYSTDLDMRSWQHLKVLVPHYRKSSDTVIEILNGIFYYLKNGCLWQDLPADFPAVRIVRYYFYKWRADGTWDQVEQWLFAYYGEQNVARRYKKKARLRNSKRSVSC